MGMFEDILGQVLKSAVNQGVKEVGGKITQQNPAQRPAAGGDPLTQILGSLLGANQKDANPILVIILKFVEANGGIMAIIAKFQNKGMKAEADSWVATGPNQLISPQQVSQVFDAQALGELGKSLGTTPEGAASTLSKVLPEVINQFSPQGEVPGNDGELVGIFIKMLQPQS